METNQHPHQHLIDQLVEITRGSLVGFDSTSDTVDKLDSLMHAVVEAGLVDIDPDSTTCPDCIEASEFNA